MEEGGWWDKFCKLYAKTGTTNHIMFRCSLAVFSWYAIKEALQLQFIPKNLWECINLVRGKGVSTVWVLFSASLCWALWLTRNDWVFNNVLVKLPHRWFTELYHFRRSGARC